MYFSVWVNENCEHAVLFLRARAENTRAARLIGWAFSAKTRSWLARRARDVLV